MVGNILLVCRQLAGIVANLTANEMLARQRYAYLFGHDGRYLNLFDQGPMRNFAQWASSEHPDWDALYAARQQVCLPLLWLCHYPMHNAHELELTLCLLSGRLCWC